MKAGFRLSDESCMGHSMSSAAVIYLPSNAMPAGTNPNLSLHLGQIRQWYQHVIAEISCGRLTAQGTCSFDCETRVTHQVIVGDRASVEGAEGVSSVKGRVLRKMWAWRSTPEKGLDSLTMSLRRVKTHVF